MKNCELIVRDIGSSKLILVKYLKEYIGTIGLKEAKWIADCMPPYNEYSESSSFEVCVDSAKEIQRTWDEYGTDWEIFIDESVPALHLKTYIPEEIHEDFKEKVKYKDFDKQTPPDLDFIGYREKRTEKINEILDEN